MDENINSSIFMVLFLQADAALMYEAAKVILDSFNRLFRKHPNIFRDTFRRGEVYNNGTKGIDCRKEPIVPFEHGKTVIDIMRQVRIVLNPPLYEFIFLRVIQILFTD